MRVLDWRQNADDLLLNIPAPNRRGEVLCLAVGHDLLHLRVSLARYLMVEVGFPSPETGQ